MFLFLATLSVFFLVILLMAIGVLLGKPPITGSCGGPDGCDLCRLKGAAECPHKNSCETSPHP